MRWTLTVRGLRQFAAASLLPAGLLASSAEGLLSQDAPSGGRSRRFEAARGTETSAVERIPASESKPAVVATPITLDRAQRRFVDQARLRAADLADQSGSAFERGLMPLREYLEQESLVQWTEQVAVDVEVAGTPVSVQRNHLARMQSALEQLQQLNQPNAIGWEADVALVEWAVADAEFQLARAEKNQAAVGRAAFRQSETALAHSRLRERDAWIGWASLEDTSHASSLTVTSARPDDPGRSMVAADHRVYLESVAQRTAEWSQVGAGIGRADRVQKAELAVDLVDLAADLRAGHTDQAKTSMRRADQRLQDLFATQREFYDNGTASIYDLSRTWLAWRELHQSVADKPGIVDAEQSYKRQQSRDILTGLADQTLDRQGRHAADITVVRLAEQMDELETLRRPARASGDYLK